MQNGCNSLEPSDRTSVRRASLVGLKSRKGLTLVEVMVAFGVLIMAICGSLLTLQFSLKSLDTARCSTLAAQLMQSQIESLRLKSWADIGLEINRDFSQTQLAAMVPDDASSIISRFAMSQRVTNDVDGRALRTFNITVTWTSTTGTTHSRTSSMRYAQNGLYDYYVSTL